MVTTETTTSPSGYSLTEGITVAGQDVPRRSELLTEAALDFLASLHRRFAVQIAKLGLTMASSVSTDWLTMAQRHLAEPPHGFISPRRLTRSQDTIICDGVPISAGIVDVGLHIHHTTARLLEDGRAPFISLPPTETEDELELWQDLFAHAEELMGLPQGTIRAIYLGPGEPDMDEDEDGQACNAVSLVAGR